MILQDEVRLLHNCRSISSEQAKKIYLLNSQIVQPVIALVENQLQDIH